MVDRSKTHPTATPAACRAAIIATAIGIAVGAYAPSALAQTLANAESISSLKALSIEDLMKIEVTSVSKAAEPLNDAAASI